MSETEKLVPQDDLDVALFESDEHECEFTPYPEGDESYGEESWHFYRRCSCGTTFWSTHCRCEQPHRTCGDCRPRKQTLSEIVGVPNKEVGLAYWDTALPRAKSYEQFEGRLHRHQQDYPVVLSMEVDYGTVERRLLELIEGKRLDRTETVIAGRRLGKTETINAILKEMQDELHNTMGVGQVKTFKHLKSRHDTSGQNMERVIVLDSMSMYKPLTYNVTPFVQDSYLYDSVLPEVPQLEKVDRENRKKKFSTGANEWQARKLDAQTTPYVNRNKSKRKKRNK